MTSPVADAAVAHDTAEAVGRRFLALIASLSSPDALTEPDLERAMRVELMDTPAGRLANRPLSGDWVYIVSFVPETPARRRGSILLFANKSETPQSFDAVCGLTVADYRKALADMGFQESAQRDELGRVTNLLFSKPDFTVGLIPELRSHADGTVEALCVKRIGF